MTGSRRPFPSSRSISPCSRPGRDVEASGFESARVSDPSPSPEPIATAPHTRNMSSQKMNPPIATKKSAGSSESVILFFSASSAKPASGYANAKRCAAFGTLNASRVRMSQGRSAAGESLPWPSSAYVGSFPDGVVRPPVDGVGSFPDGVAPPSHTFARISRGTL